MGKERKTSVRSNLKRCPLLKITKTIRVLSDEGVVVSEEKEESFNDCYKTFCEAWDVEAKKCTYFEADIEEEDDEDDEDDEDE